MNKVSSAFLAAALVALSACGGGAEEENLAANAAGEDLYNVGEGLSLDNGLSGDLGNGLGNVTLGNETDAANLSDSVNSTDSNSAATGQ